MASWFSSISLCLTIIRSFINFIIYKNTKKAKLLFFIKISSNSNTEYLCQESLNVWWFRQIKTFLCSFLAFEKGHFNLLYVGIELEIMWSQSEPNFSIAPLPQKETAYPALSVKLLFLVLNCEAEDSFRLNSRY